jgi:hypothetical protein
MNGYKGVDGSQLIMVGDLSQIRKGDGALGKPPCCIGIGPVQEVPHVRQKQERSKLDSTFKQPVDKRVAQGPAGERLEAVDAIALVPNGETLAIVEHDLTGIVFAPT